MRRKTFVIVSALILGACGGSRDVVFGTSPDAGDAGNVGGGSSSSSDGGNTGGSGGAPTCIPKTCNDYGFNCGKADNGCGFQLDCGFCSALESCGGSGKPGVCGRTPCQSVLDQTTMVNNLTGTDLSAYYAALNCVCHNPQTTNQCGSDINSQTLCGMGGANTGSITQDFFANDAIGPCCAQQCAGELTVCRGQL